MVDKQYKCYPFYTGCSSRGRELSDEEHFTNGGHSYFYYECKSQGVNPISSEPCRHCLYSEGRGNHWVIKRARRSKQGKVKVTK